VLASTTSAASFSTSSVTSVSGERVKAIKPVLVDSRIPKGPMSLRKESIRDGLADLFQLALENQVEQKGEKTYTSTIQLFVLISKTLPPN
jgi:hypothetical protein